MPTSPTAGASGPRLRLPLAAVVAALALAAPGPASARVLFDGDPDRGDLAGRWAQVYEPGTRLAARPPAVVNRATAPSRVFEGSRSAVHVVPRGRRRSELQALNTGVDPVGGGPPGTVHRFREGDDRWFGGALLLHPRFPLDPDGDNPFQVLVQWKNVAGGSPPLSVTVEHGSWNLEGGAGHPDTSPRRSFRFHRRLGPARAGVWTRLVLHVRFSSRPGRGFVEAWLDGRKVVGAGSPGGPLRPRGGTLYPRRRGQANWSDWRVGLYRNPDDAYGGPGVVWSDAWRYGTSYAAVAPVRGR